MMDLQRRVREFLLAFESRARARGLTEGEIGMGRAALVDLIKTAVRTCDELKAGLEEELGRGLTPSETKKLARAVSDAIREYAQRLASGAEVDEERVVKKHINKLRRELGVV